MTDTVSIDWNSYDHPGDDELRASVRTVTREATKLPRKLLERGFAATEDKPSDMSKAEEQLFLQQLDDESAHYMSAPMRRKLLPNMWLAARARRFCVTEEVIEGMLGMMGRAALFRTEGQMWMQARIYYNGFIKTLIELFKFAKVKRTGKSAIRVTPK